MVISDKFEKYLIFKFINLFYLFLYFLKKFISVMYFL